jgi:small GTP-binding protein
MESRTTIGVEFSQKIMSIHNKRAVVQIWDTAGQDRYKAITSAYYRAAVGALLVYDISKRSSFENLGLWIKEIQDNTNPHIVIMLLGNKNDLEESRTVSIEEGRAFAKVHGLLFDEVSALTGDNIQNVFTTVVHKIHFVAQTNGNEVKRPASKLSFGDENEHGGYFESLKQRICC